MAGVLAARGRHSASGCVELGQQDLFPVVAVAQAGVQGWEVLLQQLTQIVAPAQVQVFPEFAFTISGGRDGVGQPAGEAFGLLGITVGQQQGQHGGEVGRAHAQQLLVLGIGHGFDGVDFGE